MADSVPDFDEIARAADGHRAVLLAGPTASGKSALAMRIAERIGGEIVNADSMQVYGELRILTARPSEDDERRVPHRLYGHVPATRAYSTGEWSRDAAALLASSEKPLIFVGGTGLYFRALTEGLVELPSVPDEVRAKWRGRGKSEPTSLWTELAHRDPALAGRLPPGDTQRLVRALEVHEGTGRSLTYWWEQQGPSVLNETPFLGLVLAPDRTALRRRIERRFKEMMNSGAVEEVRSFMAADVDPELPAAKAIGVREIAGMLRGELTEAQAVDRAVTATAQYAKRQATWFRRQLGDEWRRVSLG